MKMTFRKAQKEDLRQLSLLVNSAYRGPSSEKGWTTEAALLGGQRTDEQVLLEYFSQENSIFLLAFTEGVLVGSVHLKRMDQLSAYLGMFAVDPLRQNQGVGRALLLEAEKCVRTWWGSQRMEMTVIPLRNELLAWYERRGYQRTGQVEKFPEADPRFGLPKRDDLSLETLVKDLKTLDGC